MNKKNVCAVIALLLFFIVPIFAAFWFFQHPQHLSLKTVNHGQLLQPLQEIKRLPLQAEVSNTPIKEGQWRLFYLQPQAQCDTQCQHTLYDLRQVRTALGKNQDRVVRAYVAVEHPLSLDTRRLLTGPFQGTQIFTVSAAAVQAFLPAQLAQRAISEGLLVMVDPQGYAMMVYPMGFAAKDLLADLNRLLTVN